MKKNDIFVAHIEKHLKEKGLKHVICKICGKTIEQIYEEEKGVENDQWIDANEN